MEPPPQNGSSTGGGLPSQARVMRRRAVASRYSLVEFSQRTSWPMKANSRSRRCSASVMRSQFRGGEAGLGSSSRAARYAGGACGSAGSSTSEAKSTARQAARGLRAHHRCRVEGWPWRMDFSRADSRLMASSGSATSISLVRVMAFSPCV
jgi:hypothetical protein